MLRHVAVLHQMWQRAWYDKLSEQGRRAVGLGPSSVRLANQASLSKAVVADCARRNPCLPAGPPLVVNHLPSSIAPAASLDSLLLVVPLFHAAAPVVRSVSPLAVAFSAREALSGENGNDRVPVT